eukprot:m51a1_g1484 hypothetical protein (578) ;mRNA; r:295095-298048
MWAALIVALLVRCAHAGPASRLGSAMERLTAPWWTPSDTHECFTLFTSTAKGSAKVYIVNESVPVSLLVTLPDHSPEDAEASVKFDVVYEDGSGIWGYKEAAQDSCLLVPPYKPIRHVLVQAARGGVVFQVYREVAADPAAKRGACAVPPRASAGGCTVVSPPVSFALPEHAFFLTASEAPHHDDISVYTMLTVDRLGRLEEMSRLWTGSVSAAVSLTSASDVAAVVAVWTRHEHMRRHVDVHLVLDDEVPLMELPDRPFPANRLRNVALRHCRTEAVFYIEADFVPSPNLYAALDPVRAVLREVEGVVFVVASFMAPAGFRAEDIPRDKKAFFEDYGKEGKLAKMPYRSHSSFKADEWEKATTFYQIMHKGGFEPYYVGLRTYPLFDEMFYGCGRDKVSHVQDLNSQGYTFVVVPDGFIVHLSSDGLGKPWCKQWNKHQRSLWKKHSLANRLKTRPGLLNNIERRRWWDVGAPETQCTMWEARYTTAQQGTLNLTKYATASAPVIYRDPQPQPQPPSPAQLNEEIMKTLVPQNERNVDDVLAAQKSCVVLLILCVVFGGAAVHFYQHSKSDPLKLQ